MTRINNVAPLLLTVLAGGLLSVQSGINGQLADRSQSWLIAALVSFSVGTALLSALIFTRSGGRASMMRVGRDLRSRSLSWWVLTGGLLSAGYVVLQAGTVTTLGVAMFSLAAICGLNVGSLLVDKWGVSRGTGVPLTPRRITAVVISLIAGLLAVVPYLGLQSAPTIYFLLVVAAGIGAAIQFAMTARVGEASGDSTVAAWVLFAVATVFLLGLAISQGSFANNGTSSLINAVAASPWLLIGGLLGSAVVIVNAYVVQRTGVLVFSLSLIAGQLIAALIIDQISGVLTNASFVVGACALMIFATAISAGGRGTAARPTEESPSLSSSDTPLT